MPGQLGAGLAGLLEHVAILPCIAILLPTPRCRFGGFGSAAEWDAAVSTWTRPRLEVEHVKVWAWPPRP